jgi:hypothetical protein
VRLGPPHRRHPSDFATEDYHLGRPRHPADLNATGRKQLGLQAW